MKKRSTDRVADILRRLGFVGDVDREVMLRGDRSLAVVLFMRKVFDRFAKSDDPGWVDEAIRRGQIWPVNQERGVIGPILHRLLESGARREDLCALVRAAQEQAAYEMGYVLSDCSVSLGGDLSDLDDELEDVVWGFWRAALKDDGTLKPKEQEGSIHEYVGRVSLGRPP